MDVQMVEFHHSEQPNPTDTLAHAVAQNYRGPEPRGITVEMQRENALADPGKSMITFKSIVASSAAIGVVYHENLTDVVEKTLSFAKDDVDDPKTLSAAVALSVAVALFLQGHNSIETVAQYSLSIATQVLKEEVVEDDQYESFANGLKASIENREIIPAARPNRFDPYKCLSDAFAALRLFEGADETQNRFRDIIQKVVKDPESLYPADVRANGAAAAALMGAYFGGRDFLDCYGDISREIRAIHHENFCLMGRLSGKYPNAG